jgi:hypothetical protein
MTTFDVLILGGGAAGFFTAINTAKNNPDLKIIILERGSEVLTKVKVSGGGRCNVTHAVFTPQELIAYYPRGGKELLGPFHTFMTGDTMEWFENHGVSLKIEEDGRVFPVSNSSQTIIDCFKNLAKKYHIQIATNHAVQDFKMTEYGWQVNTSKGDFLSKNLVVTSGSNPKIWNILSKMGHTIIPAVPSLFTFAIKDTLLENLQGVTASVQLDIPQTTLQTSGDLLITHQGISGPAVLKLSAWGASILNEKKYQFEVVINWLPDFSKETISETLKLYRIQFSKQQITTYSKFNLSKRLWKKLVLQATIAPTTKWADITNKNIALLTKILTSTSLQVTGKNTFKEEFVTAGGVALNEINFKRFESKLFPTLFMAGEVLNIDALTGGFNFQNAWTGGYCIAKALE